MHCVRLLVCALSALCLTAGFALAEDLTGTWVEKDSWGARAGDSHHGLSEGDTYIPAGHIGAFTLVVADQSEDRRAFHGEWCSTDKCEDLVGAVRSDGTLLMVDEDGVFEGTLIGDSLELCYSEASPDFRVVNCRIMQRK